MTRRHGDAETHAENMFGLASVLGTQQESQDLRARSQRRSYGFAARFTLGWKADNRSPRRLLRSGLVHWDEAALRDRAPGRRNDDGTGVYQE